MHNLYDDIIDLIETFGKSEESIEWVGIATILADEEKEDAYCVSWNSFKKFAQDTWFSY